MSAAKHTPGPWEIWTHSNGFIDIVADVQIIEGGKSWHGIATMNESDDVARADAILIVSATDLLAACEAVIAFVEGKPDAPEPFGMVRAAIRNATGEK